MSRKVNQFLNMFQGMSAAEQNKLVEQIFGMMKVPVAVSGRQSCDGLIRENENYLPDCPHCKARSDLGFVIRKGYDRGVQRYLCKACGHRFVAASKTAFSGTHKDAEIWRKFIRLTISGATLHECKEECGIAYQTAFTWRHKVLNVFKVNQEATEMRARVEMDEMFIPISYKGNRVKGAIGTRRVRLPGENNGLPRKSFRRGSDNKSASAKTKACVFCMVENGDKAFYASVPGVGAMQPAMLDKTVARHVDKKTALVLVDQYHVTSKYLADNQFRYMTFASNTSDNYHDHKAEIQGDLHIQHVNAMHRHLRAFLRRYCGVSTKYLENYVSLFVWMKNMKAVKQKKKLDELSVRRAATADCYITRKKIEMLPAVPVCA